MQSSIVLKSLAAIGVLAAMSGAATPADAHGVRASSKSVTAGTRDCTPYNGRYGYYGNPWCDGGAYRIEDLEPRRRVASQRRAKLRSY
jgi:hypothetical protein